MEKLIKSLFEYQSFSPNAKLKAMIKKTESKYESLSDDDLFFVAAAGEQDISKENQNKLFEKQGGSEE